MHMLDPECTPAVDLGLERLIVVHNPSNAQLAEQCVDELQASTDLARAGIGKIEKWETVKGGHQPNADELIWNGLRAGDAIAMVSGDGTFRTIAGALALRPEIAALGVPVTSLKGGNANDVRKSFHGRQMAAPSMTILSSWALTASLMDCSITYDNGHETSTYAASYIGFGRTAEAAIRLEEDRERHRKPGIIQDIDIAGGALLSDHRFTVTMDGRVRRRGDVIVSHSPHMAKRAQFPSVRHWGDTVRVTPVGPGFVRATWAGIRLLRGRAKGYDTTAPIVFDTGDTDALVQFDGEPGNALPPQTHIEISTGRHTYTVLASRYPLNPASGA